ncbi:MAG: hypothetical protein SXU28_14245 [Pseudomonadota bacterium]|nr:hypothetical protein [Pseudomonadota bacterium]
MELPQYLRRLPYLFYALALILGGWRFLNEWVSVEMAYSASVGTYGDPSFSMAHNAGRSAAIFWGVADLVYLSASAAVLQVLIAIFDKMKDPNA